MPIKDKLVSFYIKNFIMSRAQVLDKPGFILFKISGKSRIYARQVVFPESLLANLEEKLIAKFDKEGQRALYSAGKKFGYLFGQIGNFFTVTDFSNEKKFIDYINLIDKFIEGTYASGMSFEIDLKIPLFVFYLDNFVVCNSSGKGFFLPTGAAAGLVCYLLKRNDLEGVQMTCQGRGDAKCKVIYSTPQYFNEKKIPFITERDFERIKITSEYITNNEIQPTKYSKTSFQDLLNSKFLTYRNGVVEKNKMRHFIFEASGIYLIEIELNKNPGFNSILFEVSKEYGKELVKVGAGDIKSLSDILTAFGWGDVYIFKKNKLLNVSIDFYPWTVEASRSSFTVIQGILEGSLTAIERKEIKLKNRKKSFLKGAFSIFFSE